MGNSTHQTSWRLPETRAAGFSFSLMTADRWRCLLVDVIAVVAVGLSLGLAATTGRRRRGRSGATTGNGDFMGPTCEPKQANHGPWRSEIPVWSQSLWNRCGTPDFALSRPLPGNVLYLVFVRSVIGMHAVGGWIPVPWRNPVGPNRTGTEAAEWGTCLAPN